MKNLYESILSSTKIGINKYIEDIKNWIAPACRCKPENIEVKYEKSGYVIIIPSPVRSNEDHITLNNEVISQKNPDWVISEFRKRNGQVLNVTYENATILQHHLPLNVLSGIQFFGCRIKIDKLPNNCKHLHFGAQHSLGGAHGCIILKPIEGNFDYIYVNQTAKSISGLSTLLSSAFKNIKISDYINVTDSMLGGFSYEKNNKLSGSAKTILDNFLDSNDVSIKKLEYVVPVDRATNFGQKASILYNKEKDRYTIKRK